MPLSSSPRSDSQLSELPDSQLSSAPWQSTRGRAVPWELAACESLAQKWLDALGDTGVSLIASAHWKRGALVTCPPFPQTPSRTEVRANRIWLRAAIGQQPHSVPSTFFLADAFLILHAKLDANLLRKDDAKSHALEEAAKLKIVPGSPGTVQKDSEVPRRSDGRTEGPDAKGAD